MKTVSSVHNWLKRPSSLPLVVLFVILIFSGLRISGSSVGVYNQGIYGGEHHDPDLLFGFPRPVRSDEWMVNTPITVSQAKTGFHRINPTIGLGEDVSLVLDVPYKEWSSVFKPQNWPFFVLPLEQAFALKWWLLGALLLIAVYWFVLELLPGRIWIAAGLALALFLSPFLQWWYQTITLAPIFYSLFAATIVMRLLRSSTKAGWLWALPLTYCLTAFGLLFYPPFQIACTLAVGAFLAGYVIQQAQRQGWRVVARKLLPVLVAGVAAAAILAIFIVTRLEVFRAYNQTVFPGHRTIPAGGFSLLFQLSSQLAPLLQSLPKAVHYRLNQSESANFIGNAPFLLIPSAYLLYTQLRRTKKLDMPLLMVSLAIGLVLARMFVPWGDWFYHLIQLDRVPHGRLNIALGILGLIQIALLIRQRQNQRTKVPTAVWLSTGLITLGMMLLSAQHNLILYPLFIQPSYLAWLAAIGLTTIVTLLAAQRFQLALIVLLVFSLAASYKVNPLYRGLRPLTDSELSLAIDRNSPDSTTGWVTVGKVSYENFPIALGHRSLSGTYFYPQDRLWEELDPNGQYREIYNRYAHVTFDPDLASPLGQPARQGSADRFDVRFDPCAEFYSRHQIGRVLSTRPLESPCLESLETLNLPKQDFYFYKLKPTG